MMEITNNSITTSCNRSSNKQNKKSG